MTKPTALVLGIFAILIVGAAIVASQGTPRTLPAIGSRPSDAVPYISGSTSGTATGAPSNLPVLAKSMPAFQGITKWWNTADGQPLTPESLKGKVVLVDFWTYSCINCIRTYPFLKAMQDRYAEKGLVIVGVHTPEFSFEADPANVGREIIKNGLKYPIALDASYGTWNAYGNQYWPAEYLFDRQGRLRHTHFGEGAYDENEEAIRSLLSEMSVQLQPMEQVIAAPDLSKISTPETYFGLSRGDAFMRTPGAEGVDVGYSRPDVASELASSNKWNVIGSLKFFADYILTTSDYTNIYFNVQASKLHIVMAADDGTDKTLEIFVDGKLVKTVTVNASTLYTVAEFPDGGRRTVQIRVKQAGLRMYAATFS